jgi:enamine deaminase RidA (YjgF/YER057c/UK114 family)
MSFNIWVINYLLKMKIMTIERLETKQRMSRIVKHNGVIYLCGQV